jgi:3-hydroxypropanoate dehydrogenase
VPLKETPTVTATYEPALDLSAIELDLTGDTDGLALDPSAADLLFRSARTANAFTDEPVSDAQLKAIYELVKWAPTALNTQPLRVLAVRTEQARERLVPLMSEGNRAKTESAPLVVVLAADTSFHDHLPTLVPFMDRPQDLFQDDDARETAARFNASLQIGYFLLGVRAAGLAAGPMGGFDAAAVDREFFPDGRYRSMLVVNIGKPAENAWMDRLPRLSHDQVVTTV